MKKFDQYVSHLRILSRAFDEDLTNDFIDESVWLGMLRDRNDTTHIYNEEAARQLVNKVIDSYIHEFQVLEMKIKERYSDEVLSSIN